MPAMLEQVQRVVWYCIRKESYNKAGSNVLLISYSHSITKYARLGLGEAANRDINNNETLEDQECNKMKTSFGC